MNNRAAGFFFSLAVHTGAIFGLYYMSEKSDQQPSGLPPAKSIALQISQFHAPETRVSTPELPAQIEPVDKAIPEVEPQPTPVKEQTEVVPVKTLKSEKPQLSEPQHPQKKVEAPKKPVTPPQENKPLPEPVPDPNPEPPTAESAAVEAVIPESSTESAQTGRLSQTEIDALERYKAGVRAEILKNRVYPRQAKRKKQQGTVLLGFRLLPDGTVRRLEVRRSSGVGALDKAALTAVSRVGQFSVFPDSVSKPFWDFEIPVSFRIR